MTKAHDSGVSGIIFDEELGDLPRRPSFWLDDWFFWFPILKEECGQEKPSSKTEIFIKPGWGGEIEYSSESHRLTIPIGVASAIYNQYVEQMDIRACAKAAAEFPAEGLYAMYALYHNWGIEKEPWLFRVLFQSALEFRFSSLIRFLESGLDRKGMFAGDFLDDLANFATSSQDLSDAKKSRLLAIIREEPGESPPSESVDEAEVYDVALSFAGEDRQQAEVIANLLIEKGVRVFYDKHEESTLWGKDLYEYLAAIYTERARYCIVLISESYAQKRWTTHERRAAQARAFRENREYILPVRLDDTRIPGISETIGFLDLRQKKATDVVNAVMAKLAT